VGKRSRGGKKGNVAVKIDGGKGRPGERGGACGKVGLERKDPF